MASSLFKLSSDGGSTYLAAGTAIADAEALAYVSSGTYSIKAKLDSGAGVRSLEWEITSADDVHYDALPTVTPDFADKSCTFEVPKTGGTWILRAVVNSGTNLATGAADATLDRSMAVKVLNSAGQQELAVGEAQEAGSKGWTKTVNDMGRAIGSGAPAPAILDGSTALFCWDGTRLSGGKVAQTGTGSGTNDLSLGAAVEMVPGPFGFGDWPLVYDDNSTDGSLVSDDDDDGPATNTTIEGWVQFSAPPVAAEVRTVFSKAGVFLLSVDEDNSNGVRLVNATAELDTGTVNFTSGTAGVKLALVHGVRHHIALVLETEAFLRLYVNGVEVDAAATSAVGFDWSGGAGKAWIEGFNPDAPGGINGVAGAYVGWRVWASAKSASDIRTIYRTGMGWP